MYSSIKFKNIIFISLICNIFLLFFSCTCTQIQANNISKKPKIIFLTAKKPVSFILEIADNHQKRSLGLMFRNKLAQDHGMLFIFDKAKINNFWMKNTYISLDLIFLDKNLQVAGIIENTKPNSHTKLSINKKSLYVLELNAFSAQKYGIKLNSQAILEGYNL